MNEAVWMQIGSVSELMRVPDEAMNAYERALSANPNSTPALNAIGMLLKGREAFDKALDYFRAITAIDQNNGEAWGNLGQLPFAASYSSLLSANTYPQATATS
jgi:glucose repression mediator protein